MDIDEPDICCKTPCKEEAILVLTFATDEGPISTGFCTTHLGTAVSLIEGTYTSIVMGEHEDKGA